MVSSNSPREPKTVERVFTIRVHEAEPDEGGYWAEVLDLEGCVSQGETLDELTENIREAILAWLSAHEGDEQADIRRSIIMNVPVVVPR
jgi:predicted RNase H-like HicB family nuclease